MDKTLIWLLVPAALVVFYYVHISARHRLSSYDLDEYLLAGRRLPQTGFVIASTTATFLGLMVLPHMGLFYRSGFSYGFLALGAIVLPFTSAFFARRLWVLGRIYNPTTPAGLIGTYYRSRALRSLTGWVAILVALALTLMSLRLVILLAAELTGGSASVAAFSPLSLGVVTTLALLLFYHTAYGGMGAVMRAGIAAGVMLTVALALAGLVTLDALGGFGGFFDLLSKMQLDQTKNQLFTTDRFFNTLPAAAPGNMAWPGLMVASSLFALAGLATGPAGLITAFMPQKGRSLASSQFFAAALLSGFILLTIGIVMALAAHLAPSHSLAAAPRAGNESALLMQLLMAAPLGSPLLAGLVALALSAALFTGASLALMTAGAMISGDLFHERLKASHQLTYRKSLTRYGIGLMVLVATLAALTLPVDPLPLFLLAGAFGLQLLPALVGLCYFQTLTARAVRNGLFAGLALVFLTSSLTQGLAGLFHLSLPFDAWPYSVHPALWGLGANLVLMGLTSLFSTPQTTPDEQRQQLEHQRAYHVLPDGQPLMPQDTPKWRRFAVFAGGLFLLSLALPLLNLTGHPERPSLLPALWGWQFASWIIGLALVHIIAYRLQPVYDPEQALAGSPDPLKRRFRVKAPTRRVEPASNHQADDQAHSPDKQPEFENQ